MARRILFLDRDGTLIWEPEDYQIDSLEKLELLPDVIPSLLKLQSAGYEFVIVSNQDGLGSETYRQADYDKVQEKLLSLFHSQGIRFAAVRVCPHREEEGCKCRKPQLGLVQDLLREDFDRKRSAVIGDRETDGELAANMGLTFFKVGTGGQGWKEIARQLVTSDRRASCSRHTRETEIFVDLGFDGEGAAEISTGIGYLDHMLEQWAKHGAMDLRVQVKGDLHVDEHHSIEDVAITIGTAMRQALGDKLGIGRYGFLLPMDESEAQVSIDLSGRSYLVFEGKFTREYVGELPTEMVGHFFRSWAEALGATVHISVKGENTHHMVEAIFKSVARAMRMATTPTGNLDLPSTKGVL